MKTATGNALLRAYSKAVKRIQTDKKIVRSLSSAGFIIPKGQKKGSRKGFQVFALVIKFDEELLRDFPHTGGLIGRL